MPLAYKRFAHLWTDETTEGQPPSGVRPVQASPEIAVN